MIEPKEIKKILKSIPTSPGIYKMSDEEGRVIYVGKAKNLNKRVRQYFKKDYQHSTRTKKLIEKMKNIETISVDTELEAIILENNTIKQLQPKYNIIMKDDKSFVYIKITKEDYPRIQIVRHITKDGAKYIGPKTAKHKVSETFKVIKKIFPFRHCNLNIDLLEEDPNGKRHKIKLNNKNIKYPCLDYYIKRCVAPCIGRINKEDYQKIIDNVEDFLNGKAENILKNLKEQMMTLANNKKFEKAGKMRDKIKKVESILEKQKVSNPNQENKDIINYCIIQGRAYFNLFQIRDGKLIGQENFILSAQDLETSENREVLEAFLIQYYELATDIPKEILIPHALEHNKETEEFIQEQSDRKNKLLVPKIGVKNKLLDMSLKNAQIFADRNKPSWQNESELTIKASEELQKLLKLKKPLKRIECYDISHLSGTDTVGSMVVFKNGAPKNDMYRQFKIRTILDKPDDYKSMEEVLTRRLLKITEKLKLRDYSFKKARKKDNDYIKKHTKQEYKGFYTIRKGDEVVACGQTIVLSESKDLVSAVFIDKKEREKKLDYFLIRELMKKTKGKRCYICCKTTEKEKYLQMGFEEIKKNPTEIKKTKGQICLAFEKIKLKEDKSFKEIPDLIIIDGGKGQLGAGTKVMKALQLNDIPYISLAKRLEEIFVPGKDKSIILERNNEALKLVQRARDEAHRFAITFNKKLRSKRFKR